MEANLKVLGGAPGFRTVGILPPRVSSVSEQTGERPRQRNPCGSFSQLFSLELLSPTPLRHDPSFPQAMTLHQGDCVHLTSDEHLYQVIGVDDDQNRCWVRRWPMARHGSPVFEISLHLVDGQPVGGHSRQPSPVGAPAAV